MDRRDTDNLGPEASQETGEGVWPYVGVGCLTAVSGLVGGGMIAVLISKIVGAAVGCHAEAETGAPCHWDQYWTWGAWIGLILLPSVVIWRMRRARAASRNSK
ncbi:MAG: hypothetical protein JWM95_1001 [Gemmatimonadetes bacterium]|nr:hypothetical protein [Gemmatimonadota bacterium]